MKIVIVTGMSGAGKSTALNVFEDEGYYCVDNMPMNLYLSLLNLQEDRKKNIAMLHLALI